MKNIAIHVLANDPVLQPYKKFIEHAANKAVLTISKYIPISNVDITIMHCPENIAFGRISGQTHGMHQVNIYLNAQNKQFKQCFQSDLLITLAHELYHTARSQRVGQEKTLLEACVEEGLANHFEVEVTGGDHPNYCVSLSMPELKRAIMRAKKEFFSTKYNHDEWFYGSPKRKLIQSTGYNIGYFLIMKLLESDSKLKASDLVLKKRNYLAAKVLKNAQL